MTIARLIPAHVRAALLVAAGTVLMFVPFVLGLSIAATATGVLIGAITTGLGFAGTATEGRGTIPLTAHATYDLGLAVGLLAAGIVFGATGDGLALIFFAVVGLLCLLIGSVTRYSGTPAT
jgi:hypothetical protein